MYYHVNLLAINSVILLAINPVILSAINPVILSTINPVILSTIINYLFIFLQKLGAAGVISSGKQLLFFFYNLQTLT